MVLMILGNGHGSGRDIIEEDRDYAKLVRLSLSVAMATQVGHCVKECSVNDAEDKHNYTRLQFL